TFRLLGETARVMIQVSPTLLPGDTLGSDSDARFLGGPANVDTVGKRPALLRRNLASQFPTDRRLWRRAVAVRDVARSRGQRIVEQVGDHDLPARRAVAHGHVRSQTG